MKKKVIGITVLAIAAIATIGVNLNSNVKSSKIDLVMDNVEAAACSLLETDANGKEVWCNCIDKITLCGTKGMIRIYGIKETH